MKLLEYLAISLAILGAICLSFEKPIPCYIFWVISNPILIFLNAKWGHIGLVILFSFYTVNTLIGLYNWTL